jgi:transposase-like protein
LHTMTRTRRKFTPEERLSIIQEADREGRQETIRKYNIAPSLFDRWKKQYLSGGIDGLKTRYRRIDPQVRQLEEENERLKRIVAKQAIELEVKTELLKKTPIGTRTK